MSTTKRGISVTKAKNKAWNAFSMYVRLRDALRTTGTKDWVICVSCNKRYPAFGVGCVQAGHLIPGRGNSVLIDEKFVNGQCWNCNMRLKGNWVPYRKAMVERYGEKDVLEAENKHGQSLPMKTFQWLEIAEKYKKMYEELS